jgi:hypothetical protein
VVLEEGPVLFGGRVEGADILRASNGVLKQGVAIVCLLVFPEQCRVKISEICRDAIEKKHIISPPCFFLLVVIYIGTHSQFLKTEKADEDKSGELEELERKFADIEEAVKLASYQVLAFGHSHSAILSAACLHVFCL